MAPEPSTLLQSIDIRSFCYLAALLTAEVERRLVAPTRRHAIAVMELLNTRGVIDVPWPSDRWEAQPNAYETPFEQLQWRLRHDPCQEKSILLNALIEILGAAPRDKSSVQLRMEIWIELARTEVESYFEQQLSKHHFDRTWAQDVAFVMNEATLSIAQWRYCVWAAARHGASIALQQSSMGTDIRNAMHRELKRRAERIASGQWQDCAFVPGAVIPESGLGCVFTTSLACLGAHYWASPPSAERISQSDKLHL